MAIKEKLISDTEYQRLSALKSYNILDTLPEKEYDAITRLASYVCKTPISLMSLVDTDRQWFKSNTGLGVSETKRVDAFCNQTIMSNDIFEIRDTLNSDLFKNNIYVQSGQRIRFYAGAPLIDPDGYILGALCVIDRVPRELTDNQRDALKILASEIILHLVLRKQKYKEEENRIRHEIDIADKKLAELQLIEAKEEALQLSRAKDMFISVMSHEIRTPLNAVIGMSHLLQEDDPKESQKENLSILKFSAENLMSLINDVLDFTKIETGNIQLESSEVNLRELAEGITRSMQFRANDKNIYLKYTIDDDMPEIVMGDRTRICQILLNLVGNSVKFTEDGGITIDLKVIKQTQNNVTIRFAVNDTGIGIAADKIDTIFESFKQAEADTTRKYGGTGLGLAITKKLVEIHGSDIHVVSTPGKGSSFWFVIKFSKGLSHRKNINITVETELQLNILVVDDNQINRLLINKVLGKWGATVDFAENGLEAVAKIESKADYDVVLMDIHMPVMGGLEATEIIRGKNESYFQQLPIIALTASMLTSEVNEIIRSGMNDYILKPFDPKGLHDKLARYQKVS